MNKEAIVASCSQQRYEVHRSDLPLSCPMPNMELWNAHPHVYLDITTKGQVSCPYCGTTYVLVD